MDFFHPFFAPGCFISFYGGEPLLAFKELRQTVAYVEGLFKKNEDKIRYALTTNGSLLSEEILEFLDEHKFSLMLSFDGRAQDISRKKGSFDFLTSLTPKILARPRILLETNSVFSSETIGHLSDSVRCIIQMGIRKLNVNFASVPPWTSSSLNRLELEIARVGKYFESRYEHWQDVPWVGFYEEPEQEVFCCSAGLNHMALSAQGTLWGCALFPHYFTNKSRTEEYEKYCFGDVDSFVANAQDTYARKMANYSDLRMDCFSTPDRSCLMCREVEYCRICPVVAAVSTGEMGRIPAWTCQVAKIMRKEKPLLLDRFKKKGQRIVKTSPH
jgi:sulfatase maturation enzyme AslB (radical SAM superfamily)